jgi:hypothetical protein
MREDSQGVPAHPPRMAAPDFAKILRASAIRYGDFRARGVPAILLGVTGIVLAGGTVRALASAAPSLVDALREAKGLAEVIRGDQRRLNP